MIDLTKKYNTRDGRKVIELKLFKGQGLSDGRDLLVIYEDLSQTPNIFTVWVRSEDGKRSSNKEVIDQYDLVPSLKIKKFWTNVYITGNPLNPFAFSGTYSSYSCARESGKNFKTPNYHSTIPIEIEVEEGLYNEV